MTKATRQNILEFYREHKIAPVRYDLSDMDAHLERRSTLYNKLGILPLTLKAANILEVAAGTGHNSLYLASAMPAKLTLLEPNQSAVGYIHDSYRDFNLKHKKPEIINCMLEDYEADNPFDIVFCENWLGISPHELMLLQKLKTLVVQKGILVLTTISPIGLVPNVMRRFLTNYLSCVHDSFTERSKILLGAFSTHLDTLTAMTRNKLDWIQDNMINPAYFNLGLSVPRVLDQLGSSFDVIATTPAFAEDWRWFKGLYGNKKQMNEHFLSQYWLKAHNFLDYRIISFQYDSDTNAKLEKLASDLLTAVQENEEAHIASNDTNKSLNQVQSKLDSFISLIPSSQHIAKEALIEIHQLIRDPRSITVDAVAAIQHFKSLFGRETGYISLLRNN